MDSEKVLAIDRLGFKEVGWIEVVLMLMLGVIPFLSDRELIPFPGDTLPEKICSVIILLLCEELYYVIREVIKKIIYMMTGNNIRICFFKEIYGKADKPVSFKLYTIANLAGNLIPCVISGILILFLSDLHFWKAFIVIMFAFHELIGECVLYLKSHKKLKDKELIDEGRYVYVFR